MTEPPNVDDVLIAHDTELTRIKIRLDTFDDVLKHHAAQGNRQADAIERLNSLVELLFDFAPPAVQDAGADLLGLHDGDDV